MVSVNCVRFRYRGRHILSFRTALDLVRHGYLRRLPIMVSSAISLVAFVATYWLMGPRHAVRVIRGLGPHAIPFALRFGGASIGARTVFEGPLLINTDSNLGFRNLRIGSDCSFGEEVLLDLKGPVDIGDRCTFSMSCHVISHQDLGKSHLIAAYPARRLGVRIDSDCYFGACAVILSGVHIGASAIVAAGAVVTSNVEAGTVVAGVPARPKRQVRSSLRGNPSKELGRTETNEDLFSGGIRDGSRRLPDETN